MQELGPCITFMKIMTDFAGTDGKGNHWGSGYAGGVQAAPDPGDIWKDRRGS